MAKWLVLSLVLHLPLIAYAERVRRVNMKRDQIAQVRTALGVATIIQVPDSPTSLVVGDNEAFKVEFLEQAITIKPLHSRAKSNLYIYTEYRRFDVQLVTVPESSADYVVYLENVVVKQKPKPLVRWKESSLRLSNEDLTLKVKRFGVGEVSVFMEFEAVSKKKVQFDPAWVWVRQKKSTVPIHRLVLSSFSTESPIHGVVEILKSDLGLNEEFSLEVKRKKTTIVTIPKVNRW